MSWDNIDSALAAHERRRDDGDRKWEDVVLRCTNDDCDQYMRTEERHVLIAYGQVDSDARCHQCDEEMETV